MPHEKKKPCHNILLPFSKISNNGSSCTWPETHILYKNLSDPILLPLPSHPIAPSSWLTPFPHRPSSCSSYKSSSSHLRAFARAVCSAWDTPPQVYQDGLLSPGLSSKISLSSESRFWTTIPGTLASSVTLYHNLEFYCLCHSYHLLKLSCSRMSFFAYYLSPN